VSQLVASLGHRNRKRGLASFLPHIRLGVESDKHTILYCISREHQYASRYSNCRYFYHCLRVTTAADYWTSARNRLRSLLIDPLGSRGISAFQMTASFSPDSEKSLSLFVRAVVIIPELGWQSPETIRIPFSNRHLARELWGGLCQTQSSLFQ
jgi:hypothetical protein